MPLFRTIRKHFRARRIRSIKIMRWTERFIPIIQEEESGISPNDIEELAYLRAVSLVDLSSDLAILRKDELILIRMLRWPNLDEDTRKNLRSLIEQFKKERLDFHV